MGSLLKNELIKIFKKKSTYIFLIIFLLYVILTNFLIKYTEDFTSYDYRTDDKYIELIKSEIENININENRQYYIDCKTQIDFYNLYKQYDEDSWQAYIVKKDFYDYLYAVNLYKYGTEEERANIAENPEEIYNTQLAKLKNSDWRVYVKEELENLNSQLELLEKTNNSKLNDEKKNIELQIELAQLRLDKNIPYGFDFMNKAIDVRLESNYYSNNLDDPSLSYRDKVQIQNSHEEQEKAKYVLETEQDIYNENNLRGILISLFDGYSIFILIFIIMIAGSIVSSEFEKGTIKMLLVKPFTRAKILLSKYIISLLMMVFIFVITIILQLIIGGAIFGFDSLSIPAVVYNFNTNSIQTYNIFIYVLIIALNKLPLYILLATLAFAISCLFGNTVIAVVLPILGNTAGLIINELAIMYSIKQLMIFPTLNWDFTEFLFGRLPSYEFTSFPIALCVSMSYLLIMIAISWITFKKREIKNI